MPRTTSASVGLAIGALMIGLGLFVALRLLMTSGRAITGKIWLDLAFVVFFIVRGGLHFSRFRKRG